MTNHSELKKHRLTPTELRERATITAAEYAATIGVGTKQTYEGLRAGSIPSIRSGRAYKIPARYVLDVLQLPAA